MLGECVGVALGTELVQQPRRSLDVGEEKRDGAGRKIAPHRGPNHAARRAPGLVPLAREALVQVAENGDADEYEPDHEHREHDVAAFLGGGLVHFLGGRLRAEVDAGRQHSTATLSDEPGVRVERRVDGSVASRRSRRSVELGRVAVAPKDVPGAFERTGTEQRSRRRPGSTVAVTPVGARLRAQRDQLGEVGDGRDVTRLGDPDEPVRVQVVAEQERDLAVGRGEQARAAVVDEVALVDRLDADRMRVAGKRREDGLVRLVALSP